MWLVWHRWQSPSLAPLGSRWHGRRVFQEELAYQGTEVAFVLADNERIAEDALALIEVERAIDNLSDPREAQQAVDETRNQVIEGNFEAALASLSDVEMAIDASAQASADTSVSDETTASTTE